MKSSLFGQSRERLVRMIEPLGLPSYRVHQITSWMYGKHVHRFAEMTDLPGTLRQKLDEMFENTIHPPEKTTESSDGTKKYLFRTQKGSIESASIPEGNRNTLCLSTQVGCKMGCLFCMTGKQGFQGNLTSAEILNQYESLPERDQVSNIVYMGMGEPLDNLEEVLDSLEVFTAAWGYGRSPARITVSTVGILPALEIFLQKTRCHLAVSLHSPFEEERSRFVPIDKRYPLREVLKSLRKFDFKQHHRLTFEYIVLKGVNHSRRHAEELSRVLRGLRCRVNLINFHPLPGSPFAPAPPDALECFKSNLEKGGVLATLRKSRGQDIGAACGLLSTRNGKSIQ